MVTNEADWKKCLIKGNRREYFNCQHKMLDEVLVNSRHLQVLMSLAVSFLTYINDKGPLYRTGLRPKMYLSWDTMTWTAAPVV